VYAWLPVLAFDIAGTQHVGAVGGPTHAPDGTAAARTVPMRLSPFDPVARRAIVEIYEDLARSSSVEGLLFHDDAVMSDFEDASPAALATYAAAGFPASIEAIRSDGEMLRRWTAFKTDALIDMTRELAEHARRFRSPLRTARDIYARPLLEPDSGAWFAQDYDRFLAAYDRVVVMAMPLMEGAGSAHADDFLRRLLAVAASRPVGLRRTVFQLQAVDWHDDGAGPTRPASPVPAATLAREMRLLESSGARSFGYYPDDFPRRLPDLPTVRAAFSLATHPYRKP
jgi:biofilm PGA synthesis lipoprotein PgaB